MTKDKCKEIEGLEAEYDSFNLYKKAKEMTGIHNRGRAHILINERGNIFVDLKEKLLKST